ncbi:MAG: putative bifunctional diguanylate cyclase/phosphodiesterase [Acidiferrobacter sp.]
MHRNNNGSLGIEFLHKLVRELDMGRFFHIAAEGVANLLGADGAALIVKEEPDALRYWFFHGLPADYQHLAIYSFNDRLGVAGAALHARKALLVTDYPHSPYALPEYVKTGLQTSLCSPVIADGKVLAILAIAWFTPPQRLPDTNDYRTLEVVSDFMGAALHRFHIEQRLRNLAMHDPLTGAANRNLFFDRLNQAMAMAIRRERLVAVIVFDIDNFKMINDRFGHPVGDALLIEVRMRLQDLTRRGDTLARLGGDEFALILEDVRRYSEVETTIERVRQALRIRWGTQSMQIAVSVSLGVTIFPIDDSDDQTLLHNADVAMYEAKRAGGNKGLFFGDSMALACARKSDLLLDFRTALDQGEMVLYFQPIVELATGQVDSVEALIRWNHPARGLLTPSQFMAVIEHPYNSLKLDSWVISQAILTLAKWQAQGIYKKLHINLSAISVENHRFCETLRRALAATPDTVDPHYLGIELVEWSAIQDIELARRLIMDCKALGVSVALDDFGTGYASLQHLRLLPIDSIKIDRTFIAGLSAEAGDRILVQSMISAAQAFGIIAVAEGIESQEQNTLLMSMGCVFGQGYLFAKPMPEEMLWAQRP